jgi:hypothetical protein
MHEGFWIAMQEDPTSNANGPNNNVRKTNHTRGAEQAKKIQLTNSQSFNL